MSNRIGKGGRGIVRGSPAVLPIGQSALKASRKKGRQVEHAPHGWWGAIMGHDKEKAGPLHPVRGKGKGGRKRTTHREPPKTKNCLRNSRKKGKLREEREQL